uniref:TPR domain containing protein n=1 Tax=Solanum tuberosum TaxID=4113 RepID=M1AN39_SOLTU
MSAIHLSTLRSISQQPFSPFLLFPLPKSKPINDTRIKASSVKEEEVERKIEIRLCTERACRKQGSLDTLQVLSGIAPPFVAVNSCGCLGRCGAGPNVVVLPGAVYVKHVGTPTRAAETMAFVCLGRDDVEGESRRSLEALALRKRAEDEMGNGNFSEAHGLLSQTDTYDLSCTDSSLSMPHPCWILRKYTTFGESDTHPLTFLKSPSNIAYDQDGKNDSKFKKPRQDMYYEDIFPQDLGFPANLLSSLLQGGSLFPMSDAIALKPFGGVHIMLKDRCAAELAMGNLAEALDDSKEALNIAPNYPEGYICQGDVLMALDHVDAAEKSYSMALQLDPSIRRSKSFKARIAKLNEKLALANSA